MLQNVVDSLCNLPASLRFIMCFMLTTNAGWCTAHITEQRLNAGDEHLVIATQGFWDVVSADDAALLLHFHLKVAC